MKLDGIRVLDLSAFLPGPMLTMALADHGADVIKVEPVGAGEPTRAIGAKLDGVSVYFRNTQRGKRSVQVDLKSEDGRALVLSLAREADVLVETYRPGVADRLGVGYEAVRAINPAIVYCSISAFGQSGAYRDRPAHDLVVQALGGTLAPGPDFDGRPPVMLSADALGAMTGLAAVLMALLARERTGLGDYLDISMLDSLMAWTANATGEVFAEGTPPEAAASRFWGGAALYDVYDTLDGRRLALGGSEPKFAEALLEGLGRPDLIPAATARPGPAQAPVRAFLAETFRTRTLGDWEAWFSERDVCWAPVRRLDEAYADPFMTDRGILAHDPDGRPVIGTPFRFRDDPARINPHAPGLDEHGDDIRRDGWKRRDR